MKMPAILVACVARACSALVLSGESVLVGFHWGQKDSLPYIMLWIATFMAIIIVESYQHDREKQSNRPRRAKSAGNEQFKTNDSESPRTGAPLAAHQGNRDWRI